MSNPRLASNLDELLGLYRPDEAIVERFAGRYDILFQKGNARFLVSISLESETYEIGGNAPVMARSFEDVYDAHMLFGSVRCFLGAIAPLEVTEAPKGRSPLSSAA